MSKKSEHGLSSGLRFMSETSSMYGASIQAAALSYFELGKMQFGASGTTIEIPL